MNDPNLRLVAPRHAVLAEPARPRLGRILVEDGVIGQDRLVLALHAQLRLAVPVGEILRAEGWAGEDDIQTALARQFDIARVDLDRQPPAPGLIRLRDWRFWLRHGAIPFQRLGPALLVATAHPHRFDDLARDLRDCAPSVVPVLARAGQIAAWVGRLSALPQAAAASTRVAPEFSCRTWSARKRLPFLVAAVAAIAGLAFSPRAAAALGLALAALTLLMFFGLRLAGFVAHLASHTHLTAPRPGRMAAPERLPRVSVLVPLYREREIAGALVERLGRLTYPKALLEVVLVLEEADDVTRSALAASPLPGWMRVVEVPRHGGLTTKPRALNYALDFCRGDIIGVWDAEDAPACDQIENVVAHFAAADPQVVCVQGILDCYNPRSTWRSRCFTIEYASWFRIVLHGIARLGLVVPLGGTTLFLRRDRLEDLGGWDAHNVTEDADLGVRLARSGFRTELIDTVTYEEATCRAWPWMRQRSRWLKGFMVTYLVHMRAPLRLWRDLGPARFLGFQAFFLGTLGQFLLAPVLWTFWPVVLGLPHPLQGVAPPGVLSLLFALMLACELLALGIGLAAVSAANRRFLMPWVPTMILYYPLGVLAAYKAAFELAFRPFFWDKTGHGVAAPDPDAGPSGARAGPRPVSAGS